MTAKPETRVFKAYGTTGYSYGTTPRLAATHFFHKNPTKRKCNVIEGWDDGAGFVVKFGNPWPKSWKNVTKLTTATLPDTPTGE